MNAPTRFVVRRGRAVGQAVTSSATTSFLIVKTSSLGDVIHMMPAVADLRRAHPDSHISWLVDEMYVPLVRLTPAVDEVLPVSWRRWRRRLHAPSTWREMRSFVSALRRRRYDAIVDAQGLVHSGSMAKLAVGATHGYDASSIREPLAASLYDVRHRVSRCLPAIARNRELSSLAFGYSHPEKIEYGLDAMWRPVSRGTPYALMLHSSAQAEKGWAPWSWRRLGTKLAERGFQIVLPAGSHVERERAMWIAQGLPSALVPPTLPLERMVDLLRGASLIVGLDTGLVHLGAALGVPTVAIFVASDPALTAPAGNGAIAIAGAKNRPADEGEVETAVDRVLQASLPFAGAGKLDLYRAKDEVNGDARHAAPAHISGVHMPGSARI